MVTRYRAQRLTDHCYTDSTVYIPTRFMSYFAGRCLELGSRSNYLHHLILDILPEIPRFQRALEQGRDPKWKTRYQGPNQKLIKRNFKPDPHDWEILRNAAAHHGVSMCFLFVFLMRMEMALARPKYHANSIKKSLEGNSLLSHKSEKGRISVLNRKIDEIEQRLTTAHRLE